MNNKVKKRRRFKSVDAMVKALSTKKFYKEWVRQKVKKRKHRHRYGCPECWNAKSDYNRVCRRDYSEIVCTIRTHCRCGKVRPLNNKVEGR